MTTDTTYMNTSTLDNLDTWVEAYETIARQELARIAPGTPNAHVLLREKLDNACELLAMRKKGNLRDSPEYTDNKLAAGFSGLLPFAKTVVVLTQAKEFAELALSHYGLGDGDKLEALRQAFIREARGTNKQLAANFSLEALKARKIDIDSSLGIDDSVVEDTAVDVTTEAVHLKPIFGQVISAGIGYNRMRNKMITIMDNAAATAVKVHRHLLIPSVIFSVLSKDTSHTTVGQLPGQGGRVRRQD